MGTVKATITFEPITRERKECNVITGDLFRSKSFQELSETAQIFYISCVVHKQEQDQKQLLYKALCYYLGEEVIYQNNYFVFPKGHLKAYGYSPQLSNKYKKELIQAGFIKLSFQDKAHMVNDHWVRMPSVYEFIDKWKRNDE